MTPEEKYLQDFEEWVNENTLGADEESPPEKKPTEKTEEQPEEQSEESEQTPLQRLRGDAVPEPRIKPIKQTEIIIKTLIGIIVLALTVSIFLKTYYSPVQVVGPSMSPTLEDGDLLRTSTKITADRIHYDSIICFKKNNSHIIIKRVVGLPGDKVSFKDGKVFINNKLREENFPLMEEYPSEEIILGDDEYYCLGDNRNNSKDSRVFGPVKLSEITNIVTMDTTKTKEDLQKAWDAYQLLEQSSLTDATPNDSEGE